MTSERIFTTSSFLIGFVAFGHAVLTWPSYAALALFGGGALVVFVAEVTLVRRGWLTHHTGPKVAAVPVSVLFAWPGTIYVAFRLALLVADGWVAVATAGVLATIFDVLALHRGVVEGHWTYSTDLSGPRYCGIPWWNISGSFAISCVLAALAVTIL